MTKAKDEFNESIALILIFTNFGGFIVWVIYYCFYQEHIRYFVFSILKLPFYPRVLTMFIMYFIIAVPISFFIYLIYSVSAKCKAILFKARFQRKHKGSG